MQVGTRNTRGVTLLYLAVRRGRNLVPASWHCVFVQIDVGDDYDVRVVILIVSLYLSVFNFHFTESKTS